jgi:hypothetical protein
VLKRIRAKTRNELHHVHTVCLRNWNLVPEEGEADGRWGTASKATALMTLPAYILSILFVWNRASKLWIN